MNICIYIHEFMYLLIFESVYVIFNHLYIASLDFGPTPRCGTRPAPGSTAQLGFARQRSTAPESAGLGPALSGAVTSIREINYGNYENQKNTNINRKSTVIQLKNCKIHKLIK